MIEQLQQQAYDYLPLTNEADLIVNLRRQLEVVNNIQFSDAEWKRFYDQKMASSNAGLVEKTTIIQEDYVQLLARDDGSIKNITWHLLPAFVPAFVPAFLPQLVCRLRSRRDANNMSIIAIDC